MITRRDVFTYALAAAVSLLGHLGLASGIDKARVELPRKPRIVELTVIKTPEPPPEPVEEKEPEPEKPKPPPPPPKRIDISEIPPPPPPDTPPPPNTSSGETPPEEAKPVFGISMQSTVGPGQGSGFKVRVGNTTMKDPEKDVTPPQEVKAYKAPPVALHKVSSLPKAPPGGCPEAPYPPAAKNQRIEGVVKLSVEIQADGSLGDIRVVKGLGFGLDEAAIAAMRTCKWEPAKLGGKAVPTKITYTYRFVLED